MAKAGADPLTGPVVRLEERILVTRVFSVGVAAGLASLFCLGLTPLSAAQAAYPAYSAYNSPTKRPLFRPWSRTERKMPTSRWRPHGTQERARSLVLPEQRRRPAPFSTQPTPRAAPTRSTGSRGRYVAPTTGLQRPGAVFRPDHRQDPSSPWDSRGRPASDPAQLALQSQFRPTENKRKDRFAYRGGTRPEVYRQAPAAPYVTYGLPPLPVPPLYGSYWPRW